MKRDDSTRRTHTRRVAMFATTLAWAVACHPWSRPGSIDFRRPAPDYSPIPVVKLPVPPPARSCPSAPALDGEYAREYWRIGGVNGPMGCFVGMERATAKFDNGQISVDEDGGDRRVLAAYQSGDNIQVDWWESMGKAKNTFNDFLLRWDLQGAQQSDRDQVDVQADLCDDQTVCVKYDSKTWQLENGKRLTLSDTHLRDRGSQRFPVDRGPGRYRITVKGCNLKEGGRADCPRRWFEPVWIDYRPPPPHVTSFPKGWADISRVRFPAPQPRTVDEAKRTVDQRTALTILSLACGNVLPPTDFHDEETYTARINAKLAYADYFQSDRCPGAPVWASNRDEAMDSLARQGIGSRAGTTIGGNVDLNPFSSSFSVPPYRTGEYDVVLVGLVPILYRYYRVLPQAVYDHVLFDLLDKRGGPDDSDHSIVVGIPETENHIWQIESSRYLTNQLLYLRTGDPRYDNARNGMDEYVLERLAAVLRTDFVEYNARPYQYYTAHALMNLYSYAKPGPVKTAAQMVLDYISVKVAVSSSDMRRPVPFRRRVDMDGDDLLGGGNCHAKGSCSLDFNAARMVTLAGTTDLVWGGNEPPPRHGEPGEPLHGQYFVELAMYAGLSDYRVPDAILDLIIDRDHRDFVQSFHHYADELYAGSPSFNLNAGGHYATFAYKPYSVGDIAVFHASDDAGFAVPTVLMPTGWFTSRNDLLRFRGAPNDTDRSNMCVTRGFACGLNPVIPDSYLRPRCLERADAAGTRGTAAPDAPWTFFNEGGDCARGRWPYYVGFYRKDDYGFLEAFDATLHPDVSFEDFVRGVLAKNAATSFQREGVNAYTDYLGERIDFTVAHDSRVLHGPSVPAGDSFASGTIMNTEAPGKYVITNPHTGQKIVLDDSDVYRPVRTEEGIPTAAH